MMNIASISKTGRSDCVEQPALVQRKFILKQQTKTDKACQRTTAQNPLDLNNFMKTNSIGKDLLSIADEAIIDAARRVSKMVMSAEISIEYTYHKGAKEIMFKILDKESKEVICEIPPEKVLDIIAERLVKLGLIIDEKR